MLIPPYEGENAEGLSLQTQAGLQRKWLRRLEVHLPDDIRAAQVSGEGVIRSQRQADGVGGEIRSSGHRLSIY